MIDLSRIRSWLITAAKKCTEITFGLCFMKTNITIQLFQNCLRDTQNPRKLAPTVKHNLVWLLIDPRWDLDPAWLQPCFCLSFSKPIPAKYLIMEQDTPQVHQVCLWVKKNSETYRQLNKFNIGFLLIDLSRIRSWLITAAKNCTEITFGLCFMKTNITIQLFQNCLQDTQNPRKLAPTVKYNLGWLLIDPRWDLDPDWLQPCFCLSFSKPIPAINLIKEQDTPQVYQVCLWV